MVVVAKIGVTGKKGKVRTPEGIYEVSRAKDDWYSVAGPIGLQPGRVRYNDNRNLLEIERSGFSLSIHFRPELEHTTFELNGHAYEVETMDFGNISIREGDHRSCAVMVRLAAYDSSKLRQISSPSNVNWPSGLPFGVGRWIGTFGERTIRYEPCSRSDSDRCRVPPFIQSHPLVEGAVVVGSAGAILGYLAYPEPAMLIIGPFFLGLFVYLGWGMQKVHRFGF